MKKATPSDEKRKKEQEELQNSSRRYRDIKSRPDSPRDIEDPLPMQREEDTVDELDFTIKPDDLCNRF